jgi:hypothetical protein
LGLKPNTVRSNLGESKSSTFVLPARISLK